ncbi:family 43 glycosylhydrolase [Modestobacter sp. L9-4]|uniref:family 43 glycosylhydrolase n=1 Tax=Modestobacter sp. L9-4 TaxID=2851567 RepID=UPI001C78D0DF|nr:family 43 glycosylhydrolase [Modestobacter sp. L9-4]QXG77175.1 family 43 glycosylhydrolase [Modestobacter sp. L9-4]
MRSRTRTPRRTVAALAAATVLLGGVLTLAQPPATETPLTTAADDAGVTALPPAYGWFEPDTVWNGDFGDPTVVRVGNTYYAYASPVGGRVLPVLTSTDLRTWKVHPRYAPPGSVPYQNGFDPLTDRSVPAEVQSWASRLPLSTLDRGWSAFNNNDALVSRPTWGVRAADSWVDRNYWAPGVFPIGSTWYAYSPVLYSDGRFCLTVASATSPLGPFRDVSGGGPIQCEDAAVDPGGSIDPAGYHDDATGKDYLMWKSSGKVDHHPSSLKAVELGSNGLPKPGAPVVKLLETDSASPWEGFTIENPSMVRFGGTTYLFYSANLSDPLDRIGHSSYASGYAICRNGPLAPCERAAAKVPLLSSNGTAQGPGGSSAFVAADGSLRMAYATFWLGENIGGPVPNPRRMGIATLLRNGDGTLRVADGTGPVSPVQALWASRGGAAGALGPAVTAETNFGDVAAAEHFRNGSVYWSTTTGAHSVQGAIRDKWASLGWQGGTLGFPTTDEVALAGGAVSHFQGGSVYWSPGGGAHVVRGLIRDAWAASGWQAGPLGYPVTDEVALPGGGAVTHFQGGSVYWSPSTGAHAVRGAIRDLWAANGWQAGSLGYPVTDEVALPGGAVTHFQGGSVYWSAATGTHVVRGLIRSAWAASGWQAGPLGYPTTDELPLRNGAVTHFQGGSVYWSPATGAHVVRGAIRDVWAASGWEAGPVGYPTTDELALPGGAAVSHFERGSVYWSPATGVHLVMGAIRDRWNELGAERSSLGFPTSDEYAGSGGRRTDFQGGSIVWTPSTGAVVLAR